MCPPVNFAKFLKAPFLLNTSGQYHIYINTNEIYIKIYINNNKYNNNNNNNNKKKKQNKI